MVHYNVECFTVGLSLLHLSIVSGVASGLLLMSDPTDLLLRQLTRVYWNIYMGSLGWCLKWCFVFWWLEPKLSFGYFKCPFYNQGLLIMCECKYHECGSRIGPNNPLYLQLVLVFYLYRWIMLFRRVMESWYHSSPQAIVVIRWAQIIGSTIIHKCYN